MKAIVARIKKSKFWIEMPYALTWEGWEEWHSSKKKEKPISYLVLITTPKKVRMTFNRYIGWPIRETKSYISCRFIDKHHLINTGLNPAHYHEVEERLLHGAFNMLVDYVEVNIVSKSYWCKSAEERKKIKGVTFLNSYWPYLTEFRNIELGLEYLKWEMTLDSDSLPIHERSERQAQGARDIWDLYHWWKIVRPARIDPSEASGWREWCQLRKHENVFSRTLTSADAKKQREILDRQTEIEEYYNKEDDNQLTRLVKLRQRMWT